MGMSAKIYKPFGIAFDFEKAFYSLLFLFKPYIGDDFSGKNICFYDEKEWRFYPSGVIPSFLSEKSYYTNDEGKLVLDNIEQETYLDNLKVNYKLQFPISAVKMVYVDNEDEKQKLRNEFGDSLPTRIMSGTYNLRYQV